MDELRRRLRLNGQDEAWTSIAREVFPSDVIAMIPIDASLYCVVYHLGERYVSSLVQRGDVMYNDSLCVAQIGDSFTFGSCIAFYYLTSGELFFVVSPLNVSQELFSGLQSQIHPRDYNVVSLLEIVQSSRFLCGGNISSSFVVWDSRIVVGHAARLSLLNGHDLYVNLAFRAFSQ